MGFVARWFTPSKGPATDDGAAQLAAAANKPPALPATPSEGASKAQAAEEMKRLRKMRAMAGGKTILTAEGMGGETGGGASAINVTVEIGGEVLDTYISGRSRDGKIIIDRHRGISN